MRSNICVNGIVLFEPFVKARQLVEAMVDAEACPRDEITDPPGTVMLPIDRHGFAESLVSFRTLCGVQSSLVIFVPNRSTPWGPL